MTESAEQVSGIRGAESLGCGRCGQVPQVRSPKAGLRRHPPEPMMGADAGQPKLRCAGLFVKLMKFRVPFVVLFLFGNLQLKVSGLLRKSCR